MNINGMGGIGGNGEVQDLFRQPGGDLGKDEFLQLLVTQLRHQDPLNPMQAEDFAAQLAQFSSLEQLVNVNTRLDSQITHMFALAQGMNTSAALGVLGEEVIASVDEAVISGVADEVAMVVVNGEGGTGVLRFYDSLGNEVGSRELGFLDHGRHDFDLGGAESLPARAYSYSFEVRDAAGEVVPAETLIATRVDGIRYGAAGPILVAGSREIPLSAIVEVVRKP